MAEELTSTIRIEAAPEGAKPFIPGVEGTLVEFKLEPEAPVVPDTEIFTPVIKEYKPVYFPPTEKLSICINIESTGANPWDSRMICISVIDPSDAEAKPYTFFNLDEEKMCKDFIDWFESQDIEQLIAYNVSYDYRFIFAVCCKYRIQAPKFCNIELYDEMQVMQQVQRRFVPGMNKSGKLEDWTNYLFGEIKLMTFDEVLDAYSKKEYKKIISFNEDQVRKTELLYHIITYVNGEAAPPSQATLTSGTPPLAAGAAATPGSSSSAQVTSQSGYPTCKICYAEQKQVTGPGNYTCPICKTPFTVA